MKKYIILLVIGSFMFIGCTAPTQRIAERSMSVAMHYDSTIVDDLSNLAKQQALDASSKEIEAAFKDQSVDKAKLAATNLANTWESVGFLQLQNEKKRALFRIGQQFIFEQRGVLDIMIEELDASNKKSADAKDGKEAVDAQSMIDELNKEIADSPPSK